MLWKMYGHCLWPYKDPWHFIPWQLKTGQPFILFGRTVKWQAIGLHLSGWVKSIICFWLFYTRFSFNNGESCQVCETTLPGDLSVSALCVDQENHLDLFSGRGNAFICMGLQECYVCVPTEICVILNQHALTLVTCTAFQRKYEGTDKIQEYRSQRGISCRNVAVWFSSLILDEWSLGNISFFHNRRFCARVMTSPLPSSHLILQEVLLGVHVNCNVWFFTRDLNVLT